MPIPTPRKWLENRRIRRFLTPTDDDIRTLHADHEKVVDPFVTFDPPLEDTRIVNLGEDDERHARLVIEDPDEIDAVWADSVHPDDYKEGIDELDALARLRDAGWPEGHAELLTDAQRTELAHLDLVRIHDAGGDVLHRLAESGWTEE